MRSSALLCVLAVVLLLLSPDASVAQRVDLSPARFSLAPDVPVDDAVPPPDSVVGHEIGTAFTLYGDVVRYFDALAAASDRVHVFRYGATYEGRPLLGVVVTSPANHARVDAIQQANRRLANPAVLSERERERIVRETPVTVSMSYNIHGNEASSTEAAMQVAYRLAAATDAATQALLDDSVVLMWPTVNPDGRDRYVYWYKSMRSHRVATPPEDIVHDEPWPQGRTNHYNFDLNRDWVWTVHPEMRGLIEHYQRWMPQVNVDYHEQGYEDNYFTMPGTTPRNPLLPEPYDALADTFGRAHVEAFDAAGVAYFTREAFDFFYPGYGSSYPSTMGAIGMLTEQAGIGAGRAVENEDGYVLTFKQRVFDHYQTSLATVRAAVRNRTALLNYFADAFTQQTNTLDTRAYVFPDDGGNGYLYDVLAMLRRHNIDVERATEPLDVSGAMDYRTGKRTSRTFDAGTYVVRADQPRHLFVNTLLQRRVTFRDSVMYDMSTWSAPLAYNLDAYSTRRSPSGATETVTTPPTPPLGVVNPNARYAFVIDWRQRNAPRALAMLWDAGYRVWAAHEPFDTGSQAFGAGSLIVHRGRNYDKPSIASDLQRIAETAGVRVVGLDTGRMADGPDLGSENHGALTPPRVALLVDEPFSTYTAGQIWYLFDRETELPITRIRSSALAQSAMSDGHGHRYGMADLNDFDVLVLPGADDLDAVFDSTRIAALKDWVERGGTLVATEESALFFTADASGFTDVEANVDTTDATGPYTPYGDRDDARGLDGIPGAALDGVVDATHPLAFGVGERVYSLTYGASGLVPSADLQTAAHYARLDASTLDAATPSDVLVSGYASQENLARLAGSAFAATLPMGEGRVVFLVDNTQYRMFWLGPARFMQNAVMLAPALLD